MAFEFHSSGRTVAFVIRGTRASAEEGEDVLGRAGFAEHGEDVTDGVVVRGGVEVGHGVGDQGDVEAVLVGLAGGRFDADAGGDAADDDLGDAEFGEVGGEVGVVERAPGVPDGWCGFGRSAGGGPGAQGAVGDGERHQHDADADHDPGDEVDAAVGDAGVEDDPGDGG
jgi:hypothetical protein